MVKIRKQLVPNSNTLYNKTRNSRKYITIHETANTGKGANAASHANLQYRGNSRDASWHYQVDDREAVQSYLHTTSCWHAGGGNNVSIAIEICINSDGNFKKTLQNAAELVSSIMKEEGIPLGRIVQHHYWTKKDCPRQLRNGKHGMNWNQFIELVRTTHSGKTASKPAVVKPAAPVATPKPELTTLNQENDMLFYIWGSSRGRVFDGQTFRGYPASLIKKQVKQGIPYTSITNEEHEFLSKYADPVIKAEIVNEKDN